jgi:hypothetical protein
MIDRPVSHKNGWPLRHLTTYYTGLIKGSPLTFGTPAKPSPGGSWRCSYVFILWIATMQR